MTTYTCPCGQMFFAKSRYKAHVLAHKRKGDEIPWDYEQQMHKPYTRNHYIRGQNK